MALLYGVFRVFGQSGFKKIKGLFRCGALVDYGVQCLHDSQGMGMLPHVSSQVNSDGPLLQPVIDKLKHLQGCFAFGTTGNDHRDRASHGDLFKTVITIIGVDDLAPSSAAIR